MCSKKSGLPGDAKGSPFREFSRFQVDEATRS
jgi:hypothetical protein